MANFDIKKRTRARESSNAIEKLYITMRHLLNRGFYKPYGVSGNTLKEGLLLLSPEIYGDMASNKSELSGLKYVMDRLPEGIEECRVIYMTDNEGYNQSHFKPIIPPRRRRNCYRIDKDQMNIELTRGRSDVYDILTHLTFLFIESHKIRAKAIMNRTGEVGREWKRLREVVLKETKLDKTEREVIISYLSTLLGRTFAETKETYKEFYKKNNPDRFFHLIYWLGQLAINEAHTGKKREIKFSPRLRERLGHHVYGEIWATHIKNILKEKKLLHKPIHIISANMHSVMNILFAQNTLKLDKKGLEIYEELSLSENDKLRKKVTQTAVKNGMTFIKDTSGANIDVQIYDIAKIKANASSFAINKTAEKPVLIVMDYAFGEQAFEVMDELLKPYEKNNIKQHLNIASISIMGKAGVLVGGSVILSRDLVVLATAEFV